MAYPAYKKACESQTRIIPVAEYLASLSIAERSAIQRAASMPCPPGMFDLVSRA